MCLLREPVWPFHCAPWRSHCFAFMQLPRWAGVIAAGISVALGAGLAEVVFRRLPRAATRGGPTAGTGEKSRGWGEDRRRDDSGGGRGVCITVKADQRLTLSTLALRSF